MSEIKNRYWQLYHYRSISKASLHILLAGCYYSSDHIKCPLKQWEFYEQKLQRDWFCRGSSQVKFVNKILNRDLLRIILEAWEVTVTFLLAHKHIKKPFKIMVSLADRVLMETREDFRNAVLYINILLKSFPEIMTTLHVMLSITTRPTVHYRY